MKISLSNLYYNLFCFFKSLFLYVFCFLFFLSFILLFSCSKNKKTNYFKDTPNYSANTNSESKINLPYVKTRTIVFNFTDSATKINSLKDIVQKTFINNLINVRSLKIIDTDFIDGIEKIKNIDSDEMKNLLVNNDILTYFNGNIEKFIVEKEKSKKGLFREEKTKLYISVNLKIFDLLNDKIIFNKTINGKDFYSKKFLWTSTETEYFDEEKLYNLLNDMFHKTIPYIYESVSRIRWTGRIAKISFSEIYINAGRRSGLKIGDLLKVTDNGELINDPNTGKVIGVAPGRVKGTIEIVAYFGEDGSIAKIHTGGGFKVGDKLELY